MKIFLIFLRRTLIYVVGTVFASELIYFASS